MVNGFDYGFTDDDLFGFPAKSSPITQAELDDAESFDAMADSTPVKLVAPIEEDREGVARTSNVSEITGNGPVVFSSEVFSMHRLLWADGAMQVHHTSNKGETITTTTKATLVVFKINLQSDTKSSGAGKDKAVQSAHIQVEFHGTSQDAGDVGAQRPVVVGWAPFATMGRPNETTAQHTFDKNLGAGFQGGTTQAGLTVEGSASSTRAWQQRYFDKYRSRPVSVLGSSGESSNYNGVAWSMEQNSLAREGVVPELLMYLLVTRQDDSEYAVKITANVRTAHTFWEKERKCVLRVPPQEPSRTTPAVCYLEGKKMWESVKLNVDHFETLLSPAMDASLVLPWDAEETAHPDGAKSGMVSTSTKAGAKHGKEPENEAAKDEGDHKTIEVESKDAAEAAQNATLNMVVPRTRRDAATPLADKAMWDALLSLYEGDIHDNDDMEDDLPTRLAILESRLEVMEHRMARQALVIRALLKHKGR